MTLTIILTYLKLIFTSICGMGIQLLLKSQDMQKTANNAGIQYEGFGAFIKRDWKAILVNVFAIVATFLIFKDFIVMVNTAFALKTYSLFGWFDIPLIYIWNVVVALLFFATGYTGQDFILRKIMVSVQNKLIKEQINQQAVSKDTPSN